jgi:hypothetical protein
VGCQRSDQQGLCVSTMAINREVALGLHLRLFSSVAWLDSPRALTLVSTGNASMGVLLLRALAGLSQHGENGGQSIAPVG